MDGRTLPAALPVLLAVLGTGGEDRPVLAGQVPPPPRVPTVFIRGDADGSGVDSGRPPGVNLSDAVYVLNHLFRGGPPPVPDYEAGNANDDARVDLADAVYMLGYLFRVGPPPPEPFPEPGPDPTPPGCDGAIGFGRTPYIQALTPSSVTVLFRLSCPAPARVELGTAPGAFDRSVPAGPGPSARFRTFIGGLEPATRYHYRIVAGSAVVLPESFPPSRLAFTTPVAVPGGRLRLVHFADGLHEVLAPVLYLREVDLAVVAGDVVYQDLQLSTYAEFFELAGPLAASVPLAPAVGNHDVYPENWPDFRESFVVPHPACAGPGDVACGRYYSFDMGPAHLAVLDTSVSDTGPDPTPANGDLTRRQVEWLRRDLLSSRAEWKLIVCHHPPYTSGSSWPSQLAVRAGLEEVYADAPFDLVLSGHNHILYRSRPVLGGLVVDAEEEDYLDPPGFIVVISAALGSRPYPFHGDDEFGGWGMSGPAGAFFAEIEGNRLRGEFLSLRGDVLHRFTVTKSPG